ncbi:MarR family winged helix-turn-helix transcriptional regulator [Jiella marina]|uniref:MarR family winged helix-turn-helix transcriptional regulator n=1 Tax=Jiella sp. LLJ827 TaxID=2917712 RepID=UPI002100823D|nr:MarR family transcriptional regulator [Jiella sp. LLJ827]MCQ0988394.1 MarR family transcriptional regulator [Jiella sp. LLJ827]
MARKRKKGSVTGQLVLASRSARTALMHDLDALGLYPGQDSVLVAIGDEDGITLRDLAVKLSVKPPTVTKTIARLVAQGLVEKRASGNDLRQNRAFLTVAGHAAVGNVKKAQKSLERRALKGFSTKERKAFRKYLQRLGENLGASAAPEISDPEG